MDIRIEDYTRLGMFRRILNARHYDLLESMLLSYRNNKDVHSEYVRELVRYRRDESVDEDDFNQLTVILVCEGRYCSERWIDALCYRAVLDCDLCEIRSALENGGNLYAWTLEMSVLLNKESHEHVRSFINNDLRYK